MKGVWYILLCMISNLIQNGHGLLCYHCHQTTKECNSGNLGENNQKNCSEDRCALMKYETPMPGRVVLATIRDCALYTEHELLHMVSPDMKNPAKIIVFEECETHLCNTSFMLFFNIRFLIILIVLIFLVR